MEHALDFIEAQKDLKEIDLEISDLKERIKNVTTIQRSIKKGGVTVNHLNLIQGIKTLKNDVKFIVPSMEDIDLAEAIGTSSVDVEIVEEGLGEGLKELRTKLTEAIKKKKDTLVAFLSKFKASKKSQEDKFKEKLLEIKKRFASITPEEIEKFESSTYDGYLFSVMKEQEALAEKVIQALYHLEKKNDHGFIWLDLNELNPLLAKPACKFVRREVVSDKTKAVNGIPVFEFITEFEHSGSVTEDDNDYKEGITHEEGGWTIDTGKRNIDGFLKLIDRLMTDKVETKFFTPLADKIIAPWNSWAMNHSDDDDEWDFRSKECDAAYATLKVAGEIYTWMFKELLHCVQHFCNIYSKGITS